MFSEIAVWLGGGIAVIVLYVVVSNTLWLLFGSKLIQCLPGVNIVGFRGTLKIATMLVLSLIGLLLWVCKYLLMYVTRKKPLPILSEEISRSIQRGAKLIKNRNDKHKEA